MELQREYVDAGHIKPMISLLYIPSNDTINIDFCNIIYFKSKAEHWLWVWNSRKFDNHNMALTMIEILYEKQMINEATYYKIMKSNHYINNYGLD